MDIKSFIWKSSSANNCNTYLIDGDFKILIDPGHKEFYSKVEENLIQAGTKTEEIDLVICTHAHPDHIEAVQVFKDTKAKIALHEAEWNFLKSMDQYIEVAFGVSLDYIAPDLLLKEGDFSAGGHNFEVFHTPGHSPGSLCLYHPDTQILFTGDVIFNGGLGRTDLPGGDGTVLKESIRRLGELKIQTIFPGHGEHIQGIPKVLANFQTLINHWFQYI